MKGGIRAWKGRVAEGQPEADLGRFRKAATPAEHVALAWLLEEGTRIFYARMAESLREREAGALFEELAGDEEGHKKMLLAIFEGLVGRQAPEGFPEEVLAEPPDRGYMEGGLKIEEALDWARDRSAADILEMGMALEINALDRYLILGRTLENANSRRTFELLSDEERRHLERLSRMFERFI